MEPDEKYGYVLEKIRLYPHNFINFFGILSDLREQSTWKSRKKLLL